MKVLILNGPNLNLIEKRNPEYYGKLGLAAIEKKVKEAFSDIQIDFAQSNLEGELVSWIQTAGDKYDGLVINPAAYSHYSLAIRDALELCEIPKIEVHLSNIFAREQFRNLSITAQVCQGVISGFKETGYILAVNALKVLLEQ